MYIGIDLGGTNLRFGLLDPTIDGQVLLDVTTMTAAQSYQQGLGQLVAGVQNLLEKHHLTKVDGLSIGVPGLYNQQTDVLTLGNLPDWSGHHLAQDLQAQLSIPMKIMNDTALATLGEAVYGAGQKLDSFFFLIWGTGIGGTYLSKSGHKLCLISTEVGHQIIEADGRACRCGQRGCLEAYVGGWAVHEQYNHPAQITDERVWSELAERITIPLVNIANTFLISQIIFGGGFILKQTHLLQRIQQRMKPLLKVAPLPDLVPAKLGEQSALYGGAAAWKVEL